MMLNTSDVIGNVIIGISSEVTGSVFLTLLLLLVGLFLFAFAFRMPLEVVAIVLLPFLIYLMAYDTLFLSAGGVLLIYLGVLFAKLFFVR